MGELFLAASIACGVISQVIVKWRVMTLTHGADIDIPQVWSDKIPWLVINILFDRFIILSIFLVFLSGIGWIATMSKLETSFAYPFTSLGYVLVLVLSHFLFGESMNAYKIMGIVFIIIGITISSQG
jgi:multidrug transporter EmrE-like cation transporter